MFKGGQTLSLAAPIILDLAGDGVQTVSADDSDARFDLDGDGLADDTSWIGANDAFLFLDRNGDGSVSGVEEISFIDDVEDAASDLEGLAAFDSNADGVLDEQDERFDEFGIWNDADGDGAVDEGETATLVQIGIASIDLTGTQVDGVTEFGEVAIANTGSFTFLNGATGQFADAALTYFSAATNLPELQTVEYDFSTSDKKHRVHVTNGIVTVGRKNAQPNVGLGAGELGANTLIEMGNKTYGRFAPVVLDLDGDGIEMVRRKRSDAVFDYGGDGLADDTGWISGDDGFLVVDRNNDGQITQAEELSLASEDADARTGLQGLSSFDSNGDGIVDTSDARFGELRVWQDRNSNGVTDAGELRTLEDAGVLSISLAAVGVAQDRVKLGKNVLTATTSFTRVDGTTSTAADVSLAYRPAVGADTNGGATSLASLGSSFSIPVIGDGLGFIDEVPSRDDIFDMLRVGNEGALTDLFGTIENASSNAGSALSSLSQPDERVTVNTAAEDTVRTLQVVPSDQSYLDDASGLLQSAGTALDATDDGTTEGVRSTQYQANQISRLDDDEQDGTTSVLRTQSEASLARQLAIISQDMAAFGAADPAETRKLNATYSDGLEYFAA